MVSVRWTSGVQLFWSHRGIYHQELDGKGPEQANWKWRHSQASDSHSWSYPGTWFGGYLSQSEPSESRYQQENFLKAYNIVQGIKVTRNNSTEWGVALIQKVKQTTHPGWGPAPILLPSCHNTSSTASRQPKINAAWTTVSGVVSMITPPNA